MRIFLLNERPSAFTAACAHAHALSVGRLVVQGVPASRWRFSEQPVAFPNLSTQYKSVQQQKSVQLQDAQVRNSRTIGRTANGAGMALASGVPPRGKPV
jgi:hypothetical protein